MIKNLYITNIPKDETKFREILDILGDTWDEQDIEIWLVSENDYIYYDRVDIQYDYGKFIKEDLTEITYEEFLRKYQVKGLGSTTKETEAEIVEFDYDKIIKEGVVVNCKTEEQAKNLLKWADSKGLRWCNGSKYIKESNWGYYKENTCYNLFQETFDKIIYFKKEGYKILSYEEALLNPKKEIKQNSPTGGSSNYYDLPKNAKTLQDLIEFKNMNAQQKDIFKACWRMGSKEGTKEEYDVRKQVYYSLRELGRLLGTKNYMKLAKDIIGEQSEED